MYRGWILLGALAGLLLLDLSFASVHATAYLSGELDKLPEWNIEAERSYPEIFQYAKWVSIALACGYLLFRRGDAVYGALAITFVYFLLDDSIAVHETAGGWLHPLFGSERTLRNGLSSFGSTIQTFAQAWIGPKAQPGWCWNHAGVTLGI